MKRSFAARRIPRRICQDDDDENNNVAVDSSGDGEASNPQIPISVVKRPPLTLRGSSQPKKSSSLRLSFGPGSVGQSEQTHSREDDSVFTPRKSELSRRAIERNAERKALAASISTERLPFRDNASDDRQSYSKELLQELRSSTPSTPRDIGSLSASDNEAAEHSLDIAAKFGPLARLAEPHDSIIPTDAEIREKKERRARLAKEQDFMSLDAEEWEDEDGEVSLRLRDKDVETRLVPEDEDIAEGFDDFVEDGKISLGRKAEKEQERRRRAQMQEMIDDAEGHSSEETDESEAERKAAYDAAQTRKGTYSNRTNDEAKRIQRPRTPPKIIPLPDLGKVLERLKAALGQMESAKSEKLKRMEDLRAEKAEIAAEEVRIQGLLKETGEKYERLRVEAGLGGGAANGVLSGGQNGGPIIVSRGLESYGGTPIAALSDASDD